MINTNNIYGPDNMKFGNLVNNIYDPDNIKFVNLDTGNLFSGESPYIHWIPNEQSIDLIYMIPICFVSRNAACMVRIEDNNIFYLIDSKKLSTNKLESINDVQYHNLEELKSKSGSITSEGVQYIDDVYVHLIYITASSKQPGECIAKFYINEKIECCVGADFYEENEILNINLANFGVELPKDIQKSIYDADLHEDKIDNIVINRKWKELLSNYWDVIANKGSYLSLYNSLKWFEYGDLVKLCEVWRSVDDDTYNVRDIQSVLSDKFYGSLNKFAKSTYFALYCALEKPVIKNGNYLYGEDGNPVLESISSKWSVIDLSLKMCLLGNFYETYFMPVHTELIHSTIEDIVYANTIKLHNGVVGERRDYIDNIYGVHVDIEPIHYLNKVQCYVGKETLFGTPSKLVPKLGIIGVQTNIPDISDEEQLSTFVHQMFNDVGSVVNFNIKLPLKSGDKIKRSQIFIYHNYSTKTLTSNKILDKEFDFDILCTRVGGYNVSLQFDSIFGLNYTTHVYFDVMDKGCSNINIYKIIPTVADKHHKILDDYNPFKAKSSDINYYHNPLTADYMVSPRGFVEVSLSKYTQYIPALETDGIYGPQLSHMIIFECGLNGPNLNHDNKPLKDFLQDNYFIAEKIVNTGTDDDEFVKYTICIAKYANTKYNPLDHAGPVVKDILNRDFVNGMISLNKNTQSYTKYREDFIFVPEYHKAIPLYDDSDTYDVNSYVVDKHTVLCAVPNVELSKPIFDWVWKFTNQSNPNEEPIILKHHINNPLIAKDEPSFLSPGYYKVEFKYSLTNERKINTIELDGAFIVK